MLQTFINIFDLGWIIIYLLKMYHIQGFIFDISQSCI